LLKYDFADFEPGMCVLDIGCGKGRQLQQLGDRGCQAIGLDPNLKSAQQCAALGLKVVAGDAEQMPFPDGTFDGAICKVTIPYTAEAIAISEIARVLKPGGKAQLAYLGAGFYLRMLVLGSGGWVKQRFYGLKTCLNTWFFALARRALPGFLGDTLYQSRRRLHKYYVANGLTLLHETPSKTYCGFPVFIYHNIQLGDEIQGQPIATTEEESIEVLTALAS
ncbi:MAG: class I SAM-dependent methyltransferase, partial [Terriglobales bacterium]